MHTKKSKLALLVLVCAFLIKANLAYAYTTSDQFCASGFGYTNGTLGTVNGTWSFGQAVVDAGQWHSEDTKIILQGNPNGSDGYINILSDINYSNIYLAGGADIQSATWTISGIGYTPAGTFTAGACASAGGGTASSTATTTTADAIDHLNSNIAIIAAWWTAGAAFLAILWMFKRKL